MTFSKISHVTNVSFELSVGFNGYHSIVIVSRSCCIPPEKQVLLISGGESLEDEERVCKYAAGTDTNPIFLFSLARWVFLSLILLPRHLFGWKSNMFASCTWMTSRIFEHFLLSVCWYKILHPISTLWTSLGCLFSFVNHLPIFLNFNFQYRQPSPARDCHRLRHRQRPRRKDWVLPQTEGGSKHGLRESCSGSRGGQSVLRTNENLWDPHSRSTFAASGKTNVPKKGFFERNCEPGPRVNLTAQHF